MSRKRKLPDGMVLRPGKKGYWCDFRAGGRRVRKKLSTDLEAACKILNQLKARADQFNFGLLDNDFLLERLRDAYLRHIEQTRPRSYKRYLQSLRIVLAALGSMKVSQVTVEGILEFRRARLADGISPRTINHDTTVLGTMLNWGVRSGLIGSNPIKGLSPLRHDHPREGRVLTEAEVQALLTSSPEPWSTIWYALLVTGLRSMELACLTFDDIDWENRELVVRRRFSKNHLARRVPIDDDLFGIISRLSKSRKSRRPGVGKTERLTRRIQERFTQDHVFVTTQNTPVTHRSCLWHALMRCCRLADIETRRFDSSGKEIDHVDVHSLRKTFATDAITNGADPKSIQEILGHKTLDMTMKIYTKASSQTKRHAIGKLSYGKGAESPAHLVGFSVSRARTG